MSIDFYRLRRIPILAIADYLGVELKRHGANPRGRCPICRRNAFSMTPAKNLWWCFGECSDGGDGLELVVRAMRLTHTDAAELLVEVFKPQ